ncbi:Lrp/AsnC family transcriptional regulator [Candidatus Woesearchaeota archaeon]|nr:Lrp/AsnC family transcriptional regulator [Candidatus Woesearchaeota archaeon]
MKKEDKEIIKRMRKGKRLNISRIARSLNMPVSTLSDRIRRIEQKYVIKRASLLNYAMLGYFAHAKIAVKVEPEKRKEFLDFLKEQACVNSIYHINSGFDFFVEVIFRNAIDMKRWVEGAKNRFNFDLQTFQILKIEQREAFMSK